MEFLFIFLTFYLIFGICFARITSIDNDFGFNLPTIVFSISWIMIPMRGLYENYYEKRFILKRRIAGEEKNLNFLNNPNPHS
jgi:hypothetical protein